VKIWLFQNPFLSTIKVLSAGMLVLQTQKKDKPRSGKANLPFGQENVDRYSKIRANVPRLSLRPEDGNARARFQQGNQLIAAAAKSASSAYAVSSDKVMFCVLCSYSQNRDRCACAMAANESHQENHQGNQAWSITTFSAQPGMVFLCFRYLMGENLS